MPTYEYKCRACDHAFEQFQKISDPPITTCPSCGEDAVQRLISSGGGIVFRGSGFYATDYRTGAPPKSESSDSDAPKKTGDGADSKAGKDASSGSGKDGDGS